MSAGLLFASQLVVSVVSCCGTAEGALQRFLTLRNAEGKSRETSEGTFPQKLKPPYCVWVFFCDSNSTLYHTLLIMN
jgi:hypothetical protein